MLVGSLLTACGASLGDPRNGGTGTDGAVGGDAAIDSPAGSNTDAPPVDAAPACASGRVVYLNFEGVTLTKAAASDATTNHASWVGVGNPQITSGAVPPYHNGQAGRATDIQTITTAITGYFTGSPVQVVTTRPASGEYIMVAFGGTNAPIGVPYTIAVNSLDCGDLVKNDVAWVSDSTPLAKAPGFAIGAILYGLGMTATNDPADCMCGWDNQCQQSGAACTVSAAIASDNRCGATTQNEVAALQATVCAH